VALVEGVDDAEVNRVWDALPRAIISPPFVEAVLRAGQIHGLVAVVGAERAPASDEEWCREELKKWIDGCRPKQPLVTRLQAALQEAVQDGDRRSPFYPYKEQVADPRGRSAMDRVFTARAVELRGRHPDVVREIAQGDTPNAALLSDFMHGAIREQLVILVAPLVLKALRQRDHGRNESADVVGVEMVLMCPTMTLSEVVLPKTT